MEYKNIFLSCHVSGGTGMIGLNTACATEDRKHWNALRRGIIRRHVDRNGFQ
jgi:hypothetical protein